MPYGKMKRDQLYSDRKTKVPPFEFNAEVADVFDDMICRSVPMYAEIIRRQARMIAGHCSRKTRIYDLGSSTGNLAMALCDRLPAGAFEFIAVDTSQPMLDICAKRLDAIGRSGDIIHQKADIRKVPLEPADVVAANFTLQFIPPADRDALVQSIHATLAPGGIFLFSEKTIHPDPAMADLEVDFYYRFKKENGYSELEISQKREALENVLVPETVADHENRLRRCGFAARDLWLKWFNFCSWICVR
jgi:tRNA (cmo5U34)-methyltransferase